MNASVARLAAAIVVAGLIASSSVTTVGAGEDECREAVDRYNSAMNEAIDTARRYSNCVAGSQGNDDCSGQFRRVKNAQSDFESAVSEYSGECR